MTFCSSGALAPEERAKQWWPVKGIYGHDRDEAGETEHERDAEDPLKLMPANASKCWQTLTKATCMSA